jgi:hypothetical protein
MANQMINKGGPVVAQRGMGHAGKRGSFAQGANARIGVRGRTTQLEGTGKSMPAGPTQPKIPPSPTNYPRPGA